MTSSNTVISVEDVSKRFVIRKEKSLKERIVNFGRSNRHKEDFWALRDVSFEVNAGSTIGLIGANGSGKSTLLKTIGGIIQPTSGVVRRRGRLAALLELGAGFHPDLTGRENVYLNAAILGLTRKETDAQFDSIVDFSGIEQFIDTQVKFYSSGMYVRLAFAVAIHVDPEVLLVDEVLAVGDEPFQRKCMDRIRAFQADGRTIVLVSHSLETVGDICDRGIVLSHGVVQFDGDTPTALRTLREGFEAEGPDRSPESLVTHGQITDTALVNPITGEKTRLIRSGDSLRFDVTVDADRPIEGWVVGMGIDTPLGHAVFGTNTIRLGIAGEPFTGAKTVSFSLPNVQLGTGSYFVHASFGAVQGGEFHRIPQAATIEVQDHTNNVGQVSIDATVDDDLMPRRAARSR
ncbi:MAG: type transport system ATP-binding protein [Actinomycetota bacterium]|nr:type transport system ATP-binding protein [Actinomycetota bacterium]MDQ1561877.1 type transport system ATP-binding protein [Actinomycetota bacterium]MDQ1574712.1 type transport system ATP-binding protein [Actinomycetota bacterium]